MIDRIKSEGIVHKLIKKTPSLQTSLAKALLKSKKYIALYRLIDKDILESIKNDNIPSEEIINHEAEMIIFLISFYKSLRNNNINEVINNTMTLENLNLLATATKDNNYRHFTYLFTHFEKNHINATFKDILNELMLNNTNLLEKSDDELKKLTMLLNISRSVGSYVPESSDYEKLISFEKVTVNTIKEYQEKLALIGYMNDNIIEGIYLNKFNQIRDKNNNIDPLFLYASPDLVVSPENKMPYYWHKRSKLLGTDSLEYIKNHLPNDLYKFNKYLQDSNENIIDMSIFDDNIVSGEQQTNYGDEKNEIGKIENISILLNENKESDLDFIKMISKLVLLGNNQKLINNLLDHLTEEDLKIHSAEKLITEGYVDSQGFTELFFKKAIPENIENIIFDYKIPFLNDEFDSLDPNWREYFNSEELNFLSFFSNPNNNPTNLIKIFKEVLDDGNNKSLNDFFNSTIEKEIFVKVMTFSQCHNAEIFGQKVPFEWNLAKQIIGNDELFSYLSKSTQQYLKFLIECRNDNFSSHIESLDGLWLNSGSVDKYFTENGPGKLYAERLFANNDLNLAGISMPSIIKLLGEEEQFIIDFINKAGANTYGLSLKTRNLQTGKFDIKKCFENGKLTYSFLEFYWGKEEINVFEEYPKLINYLPENLKSMVRITNENSLDLYEVTSLIPIRMFELNPDIILNEVELLNKISDRIDLVNRIEKTNNQQIINNKEVIISELLSLENPTEIYDEIAKMYEKNNLPNFSKHYKTFEFMNADLTDKIIRSTRTISPILLMMAKSDEKNIKPLIFSDLLKTVVKSNNRSLKNYLFLLEYNYNLFESYKLSGQSFNDLAREDKKSLKTYSDYLHSIYNSTESGQILPVVQTGDIEKDISDITDNFSPTKRYTTLDRIARMFGYGAGYNTFEQLTNDLNNSVIEADERNRSNLNDTLVLDKGDFLKGVGSISFMENILQNGSVAKEYLGVSAGSDMTPLDTDVATILTENLSLEETINLSIASNYGSILFVLKNDERFKDSREDTNIKIENYKDKIEYFQSNVYGEQDHGIRTGFPSTAIDSIVTKEVDKRIELEVVKNGFYIPIYEKTTGQLVFSPEDYDKLSSKMNGLKYYDRNDLELSENISSIYLPPNIYEDLNNSIKITNDISSIIKSNVEESLKPLDLKMSKELDSNITPGQVDFIDTGSTGRATNTFNDVDFDYMMRVDREILYDNEKLVILKDSIKKSFKSIGDETTTHDGHFRFKDVLLEGLDKPVDIDITFVQRTDEIDYTTDMALNDKLDTIKEQSPEKYNDVILNILTAKKILKKGGAYKPFRGHNLVGGLGGIGVENWILQNGGSFIDAANSFLIESDDKNFEEFKSEYQIWDFGHNFIANNRLEYSHDNFIEGNMNEEGYEAMKITLKAYLTDLGLDNQELGVKQH